MTPPTAALPIADALTSLRALCQQWAQEPDRNSGDYDTGIAHGQIECANQLGPIMRKLELASGAPAVQATADAEALKDDAWLKSPLLPDYDRSTIQFWLTNMQGRLPNACWAAVEIISRLVERYTADMRTAFYDGAKWREATSNISGDSVIKYQAEQYAPKKDWDEFSEVDRLRLKLSKAEEELSKAVSPKAAADALLKDAAMIIKRLAAKIDDSITKGQALDWLQRNGLQGSPLRFPAAVSGDKQEKERE